jgi:microcin C transport system substrate-binding protein
MKLETHLPVIPAALALALALSGCGRSGDQSPAAAAPAAVTSTGGGAPGDAFPGMEADLRRTLKEESDFYVFKTPADFERETAPLKWEDGSDLPEFADINARKGGTLDEWIPDFPRTFRTIGPEATDSFREYLLDYVEPVFVRPHPGVPGRFYPELAQAWAVDRAAKTVYFRLNPAARWSDGLPLTTDDVVFSWYFYRSKELNEPWYNDFYHKTYSRVTVYDAHSFAITLRELKPDIVDRAGDVTLYAKHFFGDFGPHWEDRHNWRIQPTLGPYTIREEDIKKQVSVTLSRITDWWARDNRFMRGRFNPDRVRLVVIRDPDKAFESFVRGDIDIFPANSPHYWYDKLPNDDPLVAAGYIVKAKFFNRIPPPDFGLYLNDAMPGLDDLNVRLGIQYATNMDLVCRQYYRGDDVRQQTRSDGYGWRVNPTISARPFDPDRARAYFAKAGYTRQGPDGVLVNGDNRRLSFTITAANQREKDILSILKQEALKAGLEFTIEILDETTGWMKMQEKHHEIALAAFNRTVEMYPRYWEQYAGENAYDKPYLADGSANPARKAKPNTNNLTSTAIYELDSLIHEYDHADSMDQIKVLASKIEQIIYDDASWVNGWKAPFYRVGYWRWVSWPANFNAMQSLDYEQFWLMSVDMDAKKATLEAKGAGQAFPKQVLTFDQYKDE